MRIRLSLDAALVAMVMYCDEWEKSGHEAGTRRSGALAEKMENANGSMILCCTSRVV